MDSAGPCIGRVAGDVVTVAQRVSTASVNREHAVAHALEGSFGPGRALRGQLAQFRDVLISDATVIRLHEMLRHTFPACRTNHTKAAAKRHLVMNISGRSKVQVDPIAEQRRPHRLRPDSVHGQRARGTQTAWRFAFCAGAGGG